MARALILAREARGHTHPNPPVGAVLVRRGEVVGEGRTQPAGGAHAEVVALSGAGQRARGADLFVTLEPCTHWGRTPPCADALIAAGIRSAHIALLDPNPVVN
ncbi:MAG: bifunctional diaminohydroxyphosphoribosylaminopyrimidine deaminase/5-amino-6-(5-phosphoribosylamino)uracil reductase RibD, partial [Chloroflexota bacterium]|nr:bifunctional diaminohydroxyphosphoribosylaminopyrimidine deaminase/5-amino-6-(5-phosphoribosylamino)uracil reductase RibD [Chloroflexota bacterium]